MATPQTRRSRAEVTGFSGGLELVPPGVVQVDQWRPDLGGGDEGQDVAGWGGAGRKH